MTDHTQRKLDPHLRALAAATPLVLGAETSDDTQRISVLVDFSGSRVDLEALGVAVASFEHGIATGTIAATQVAALAADARVMSVEATQQLASELDLSAPAIGAHHAHNPPLNLSGRGVIIGIVDTGIDLWHPAFQRAGGQSAVVSLWDQNLARLPGEQPPAGFGYGVEYSQQQINQALAAGRTSPLVRHRDTHGHGSHVAGIAAGGVQPYQGIAPNADMIIVATASDARALGDSARTLDAIRYVFARAAELGRPAVVNLSLGSYLGPHDGTSLLERGIDALLATPGRALVKAAGNAGGAGCHASGTLAPGQTAVLPIDAAATGEVVTIDLWYAAAGRFETVVTAPDGSTTTPVAGDELRELFLPNGNTVSISSILDNPANGDNRIYLSIAPAIRGSIAAGRWTMTLRAMQPQGAARFDAWIERGSTPPRFAAAAADERMTISVPGTARRCIAVAAFADHNAGHMPDPLRPLLPFSSRGPTRDGRMQPALAAPGGWIASVRSGDTQRQPFGDARWTLLSGTSMAAPHVSGAVALLLEQHADLSAEQIRERLGAAAVLPAGAPGEGWGAGAIDLTQLFQLSAQPNPTLPSVRLAATSTIAHARFDVQAGEGRWYAVELATDLALFAAPAGRRYTDASTNANFFASWRAEPLLDTPSYTMPPAAWEQLQAAPQLYYRVLTSSAADSWNDVRRSTPDRLPVTTPVVTNLTPAPAVPVATVPLAVSILGERDERN